MRFVAMLIAVLFGAYGSIVGGLAVAMRQPPDSFGQFMAKLPPISFMVLPFRPLWMAARAGKLQVGQNAPDFSLKTADAGSTVSLASFRGKRPVVLVFGSYT
jgi:hypothetical protein